MKVMMTDIQEIEMEHVTVTVSTTYQKGDKVRHREYCIRNKRNYTVILYDEEIDELMEILEALKHED